MGLNGNRKPSAIERSAISDHAQRGAPRRHRLFEQLTTALDHEPAPEAQNPPLQGNRNAFQQFPLRAGVSELSRLQKFDL
jgi:hypothetical protein